MNRKELFEAEAIHREEALKRVAALVRRYELTRDEVLQIWADSPPDPAQESRPSARRFDPFFDVY